MLPCNRYLPAANEVCEGYVFTPVCLSTGGGACVVVGARGSRVCVVEDMHGRGACPLRQILRDTVIGSMSGRYASYWNAFLLRMSSVVSRFYCRIFEYHNTHTFIDFLYSMKDKTVPLTVPATPKKVPTPTSTPASALQTSVTQEESESEEEDDNVKPRGKQS